MYLGKDTENSGESVGSPFSGTLNRTGRRTGTLSTPDRSKVVGEKRERKTGASGRTQTRSDKEGPFFALSHRAVAAAEKKRKTFFALLDR